MADLWTGILDPGRATTWTGAGVAGGIPTRTTTFQSWPAGSSTTDIQNSIIACPTGQVVLLGPGTFTLGGIQIVKTANPGATYGNGITLRGSGPTQTRINFTGNIFPFMTPGASIAVWSNEQQDGFPGSPRHTANWTAGYSLGTTVITLDSVTSLLPGMLLQLDQTDSTDGWPAVGDIFVDNSIAVGEGGNNTQRPGRGQNVGVTVVSITGTAPNFLVTIDPPLYLPNWRGSQSPGAYWGNVTTKGVGIEDMTIVHDGNNGGSTVDGIDFHNALNCWVKNVRSLITVATTSQIKNIRFNHAARITVRDSYLYGPIDLGSEHYGISPEIASDCLMQNNILHGITSPYVPNGAASGNVFAYNYFSGDRFAPSTTIHSGEEMMSLLEGNQGTGCIADVIHGHHHFITIFRNLWLGPNPEGSIIFWFQSYSRFFNVVGNVAGGSGTAVYETEGLAAETHTEVFGLGSRRSTVPSYANVADDPRVKATLFRWGNYDTVTGAVRFVAAENPSTITNFANLANPSQTFPPSFYLTAQPTWWGVTGQAAIPWPATGPDVLSGNITGVAGHANKIPARVNFETLVDDPAFPSSSPRIKIFDGSVYVSSAAPPTPEPLGTFPVTKTAPRGVFVLRHR